MKMFKKSVFLLLAAMVVASCSKTELQTPAVDGGEIVLKSQVGKMDATTRTPFVDAISTTNPFEARVLAALSSGSYTTPLANGTMTFSDNINAVPFNKPLTSGVTTTFQGTDPAYLTGIYPATWGAGGWSISGSTATFTFTGKEDIMSAPEVSTSKAEVAEMKFATLAFSHALTKLELNFRANGQGAIEKFGTITDVKLKGALSNNFVNTGASVNLVTGAVTIGAPTSSSFACYDLSVDADGNTTYTDTPYSGTHKVSNVETCVAYSLVAPVEANPADGASEYTFAISYVGISGVPASQDVSVTLKDKDGNPFSGSTQGYAFSVTFHCLSNEIEAVATVEEWKEGGHSVAPME